MVEILDARGEPMKPARPPSAQRLARSRTASPANLRPQALHGGTGVPYDAADWENGHVAGWHPWLWSPDGEIDYFRDTIVSRVRDLVRNDGWASGVVTRILDNAVGANFRPSFRPDYAQLALYSGNKAFDQTWAFEFGQGLNAHYRAWTEDPLKWCDVQNTLTMGDIFRIAFRHKVVDGDALAVLHWLPERVLAEEARWATHVQLIDPDRLSNPQQQYDTRDYRGGVVVDEWERPVAYMIRKAHQNDWWNAAKAVTWEEIPRMHPEIPGRFVTVHDWEKERAGSHRGGAGVLAPIVQRLKMLIKYDGAELDAAIINAVLAAYVESPFDPQFAEEIFGEDERNWSAYQNQRADFHKERRTVLGDAGVQMLFPQEKIVFSEARHPSGNFGQFEKNVLRNVAQAAGVSTQQASNDWSDVNYSSARAALQEYWKTNTRRRVQFVNGFAWPIAAAFVEELMMMGVDDLPLPRNAPAFHECRAAYSRARWLGPGRGWVDLVNEAKGSVLLMDACLGDFDSLAAEQGEDPDDLIAARAHTLQRFKAAGLEAPTWSGMNPQGEPAQRTIEEPKAA